MLALGKGYFVIADWEFIGCDKAVRRPDEYRCIDFELPSVRNSNSAVKIRWETVAFCAKPPVSHQQPVISNVRAGIMQGFEHFAVYGGARVE